MADQTTNGLFGIAKTLRDVVAPAVTAEDPLAQQELRMAVRYLEYLRVRVDHLYARARFELTFHADLAETVGDLLTDDGAALEEQRSHARTLLATPGASIEDLRACSGALAVAVSDVVRSTADPDVRTTVDRAIVRSYERITSFERTWYLPLGMDHFGAELPSLESFLAPRVPATAGAGAGG